MINKRQPYSEEELKTFLLWWENDITPQKIFGLEDFNNRPEIERLQQQIFGFSKQCPYDADTVELTYKKLRIKSHPDRYKRQTPEYQQDAQKMFNLLAVARDYLLFTINSQNPITNTNVFYAHYHLDWSPNESLEGKFENFVKLIYNLKEQKKDTTEQILVIQALIQQQPDFILHTKTKGKYSTQLSGKDIVYCAAQWNEAALMDWLLTHYPSKIDTLKQTEFGVSPLDIAMKNGHVNVLLILKKHYGDHWMKTQLRTRTRKRLYGCFEML